MSCYRVTSKTTLKTMSWYLLFKIINEMTALCELIMHIGNAMKTVLSHPIFKSDLGQVGTYIKN